jgi:hypothetical protein
VVKGLESSLHLVTYYYYCIIYSLVKGEGYISKVDRTGRKKSKRVRGVTRKKASPLHLYV